MKINRSALCFLLTGFFCSAATADEAKPPAPSTFARFVPERMDDFAWENDLIAFRAYGPALRSKPEDSGIDVWMKRVPYPIIDKWYAGDAVGKSYHEDHGEGYDNYHVGGSRGCGGLALWIDGKMVTSDTFTDWKIVRTSQQETVFILHYEWQYGGNTYTEDKEISIQLGQRLFQTASTFKMNGKIAPNLPIAIGLVRHHPEATVLENRGQGWMAVWETIDDSYLGTAVVIDPAKIDTFLVQEASGDSNDHAIFITHTDNEGRVVYHAGYGWQRAGQITTLDQWAAYLKEFSKKQ